METLIPGIAPAGEAGEAREATERFKHKQVMAGDVQAGDGKIKGWKIWWHIPEKPGGFLGESQAIPNLFSLICPKSWIYVEIYPNHLGHLIIVGYCTATCVVISFHFKYCFD